jgi:hypothetical protein
MNTMTTAQKAQILDQDDQPLTAARHNISSDSPAVGFDVSDPSGTWAIAGSGAGVAILTAFDKVTGASATMEVTVTLPPFAIHLGTAVPK